MIITNLTANQAPHMGNDEADAYEIYIDLRAIGTLVDAPASDQADRGGTPEVLIVYPIDPQAVRPEDPNEVPDGNWGLTEALISRGASGLDTKLPPPSITDRPNRLRRKPGRWARRRRNIF